MLRPQMTSIWVKTKRYWYAALPPSSTSSSELRNPLHSSTVGCGRGLPDDEEEEREKEKGMSLSSRLERVPMNAVSLAFQSWMGEGKPVGRGDIFHSINRLRSLLMDRRALQVAEWVVRERPYKLKEIDYSYLLEFTAKVHGMDRAEKLFMHIPPEYQNELLYNNLVMACLERRLIGIALQYMKKMREHSLPIAPMIYNQLILLNESLGHKKSIDSILVQMKADGVAPNTRTYNILLKIKSRDYDIEGIQNVYDKMNKGNATPNEITYCILARTYAIARLNAAAESFVEAAEKAKTGTNWSTLDILMSLYGSLRKEEDLQRTWQLVKSFQILEVKATFWQLKHLER